MVKTLSINKVNEHSLWLNAPHRLTLSGVTYDPANSNRITIKDGQKYLNTYNTQNWGKGSYVEKDVDAFKQFLAYLMPNKDELDYFTQWLAAKAQNVSFRGAAILMVAPMQGTGRSTLSDMVSDLFQHGKRQES